LNDEQAIGRGDSPGICGGACGKCTIDPATCTASGEKLRGWRLVLGAAATFLLPLLMGFAGSLIGGESDALRTAAAGIGLAIGVIPAIIINKLIVRSDATRRCAIEGPSPSPIGGNNP